MILGIDEVGRGPWAGPLVVGAVVLPDSSLLSDDLAGLTDSKKLTAKRREELDIIIRAKALGWGLGWVSSSELDEIGLSQALCLATVRAVEAVKTPYHEIVIDGTINFLSETTKGEFVTTMPKADLLVPAVSAASIIAKVARDSYMAGQDSIYPGYGFGAHVGYGTAKHRQALSDLGVTPLHRVSFAPIKKLLNHDSEASSDGSVDPVDQEGTVASGVPGKSAKLTTKQIGDTYESLVADYLIQKGYSVEARNWHTKYCEIDIVAIKNDVRYFVEVKYRSSRGQGGGVAAVGYAKLRQMKLSAELYSQKHVDLSGIRLVVADVSSGGDIELFEVQ